MSVERKIISAPQWRIIQRRDPEERDDTIKSGQGEPAAGFEWENHGKRVTHHDSVFNPAFAADQGMKIRVRIASFRGTRRQG
jgi:hypothetical protein